MYRIYIRSYNFSYNLLIIVIAALVSALLVQSCSKNNGGKPITVQSAADKTSVKIGQSINFTVKIKTPKGVLIEFPDVEKTLGGLVICDYGTKTSAFTKETTRWFILKSYEKGKYSIPQLTIKYKNDNDKDWNTIETNKIDITVEGMIDSQSKNIRDVKTPQLLKSQYAYLAATVIAIALLLTAAYLIYRRLKNKKQKPQVIIIKPAHEIAYEALQELLKKDLIAKGMIKEYYTELSYIVRVYLENRFALKAPEMTTEEFLYNINRSSLLKTNHKDILKDFLTLCDMVKFAKYDPQSKETQTVCDKAKLIIAETKEEPITP
ncbi:hypothetical protein MCHI_001062 [Candidatus Magnetoovum chiemensis]|nr:hypothetical protein MCHI_001062 [Candidatus Magnetoovum chiemensis]